MQTFNAEIAAAIAAHKPVLAESFAQIVRGQFKRIVEKHGPTCKGAANDWDFARVWSNTVSRFVRTERVDGDLSGMNSPRIIDETRLAKAAAEYADAVAAEWLGKITEKLGEMETAECPSFAGDRFTIVGTRGGKQVRIEQDRILNISSKGTLFNQFPARIYVDGKFTSAAAYKRAFAA